MAAPGRVATEWRAAPAGQLDPEGRLAPEAEDEADEGTSWSDAAAALGAGRVEAWTEEGARAERETPTANVCTSQGSGQAIDQAATSRDAERQTCARPRDLGGGLEGGWRVTVPAPRDVPRLFPRRLPLLGAA